MGSGESKPAPTPAPPVEENITKIQYQDRSPITNSKSEGFHFLEFHGGTMGNFLFLLLGVVFLVVLWKMYRTHSKRKANIKEMVDRKVSARLSSHPGWEEDRFQGASLLPPPHLQASLPSPFLPQLPYIPTHRPQQVVLQMDHRPEPELHQGIRTFIGGRPAPSHRDHPFGIGSAAASTHWPSARGSNRFSDLADDEAPVPTPARRPPQKGGFACGVSAES